MRGVITTTETKAWPFRPKPGLYIMALPMTKSVISRLLNSGTKPATVYLVGTRLTCQPVDFFLWWNAPNWAVEQAAAEIMALDHIDSWDDPLGILEKTNGMATL
jgi:hypothetical protein